MKAVAMLRRVQLAVMRELSPDDLASYMVTVVFLCSFAFPEEITNDTRPVCRRYERQVVKPLLQVYAPVDATASILQRVGDFLRESGKYSDSERCLLAAVKIFSEMDDPKFIDAIDDLANLFADQGRWDEAASLQEKIVEFYTSFFGAEDEETLTAMAWLSVTYREQGRLSEAAQLQETVLQERLLMVGRRLYGEEDHGVVSAMGNLGLTYREQGRLEESAELQEKVLEATRRLLGEDDSGTLSVMINLGLVYHNLGRTEEAVEMEEKALELARRTLGEGHIDTLKARHNLGLAYAAADKVEEAVELEEQTLKSLRKLLGEDHHETLGSMTALGRLYGRVGRWDEALKLLKGALEKLKQVVGDKNRQTLATMAYLAWAHSRNDQWPEALELQTSCTEGYKALLGEDHHDTQTTLKTLEVWRREHAEADADEANANDPDKPDSSDGGGETEDENQSDDSEDSILPVTRIALPTELQVILCRYESGRLVRTMMPLHSTKYLAISHIWGKAIWQSIPGIDGLVLVSNEKAKFLIERMPALVEGEYFWMDVFCIDQNDIEARVAVTQYIPRIFRFAQRTIVIRDGWGFRNCCVEAMSDSEGEERKLAFAHHHIEKHTCKIFKEGALSRLWLFQEIILSNNIQFVRCDDVPEKEMPTHENQTFASYNAAIHLSQLTALSLAWGMYGTIEEGLNVGAEFKRAFLNCTIVRRPTAVRSELQAPTPEDVWWHLNSRRRTSESRDFILGIMPQFEFYTVPKNAKQMTFGQLFHDFWSQLALKSDSSVTPLLIAPFNVNESMSSPSANIPEPTCLGDFLKLLNGASLRLDRENRKDDLFKQLRDRRVQVQPIITSNDQVQPITNDVWQNLLLIVRCIKESRRMWKLTALELPEVERELKETTAEATVTTDPASALPHLQAMLRIHHIYTDPPWQEPEDVTWRLINDVTFLTLLGHSSIESLIRMAALFSCGLGVNAFEWSRQNLTPVLVEYGVRSFMSLVPDVVFRGLDEHEFSLVQADAFYTERERWTLFARRVKGEPDIVIPCLFPPDVSITEE